MAEKKNIRRYDQPAGGWGALTATREHLLEQDIPIKGAATLLRMNQPEGFDCPGCAWPDPKHTSSFEFCENGAKAVAWEATAKRCTPEFFAAHTVTELAGWHDYDLEMVGRLTHPMAYDATSDRYLPLSWEEAFDTIGRHLRALPDPNMAEFYTSGRTSNEAAFLYQLLAREYGTNNFPDCSNMCHEATSVGLPFSLGVGKGTVLLDDFDKTDCIFIFGQNPGTNSPRMMTSPRNASRRGTAIISFNPFRERALERFESPQSPVEMLSLTSTPISMRIHQVRVGGDIATLKGLMKVLVEEDEAARPVRGPEILDWGFIDGHTIGIEALVADLKATPWQAIERCSGLSRAAIEEAAHIYMKAERAIVVFGMGLTQHRYGAHNMQQLANLCLLRSNIGKDGAGLWLAPVPVVTLLVLVTLWRRIWIGRDMEVFLLAIVVFLLGFAGLIVSLWPYVVPRQVTIWDGISDPSTLAFVGVGAVIIIPIVLAYQAHAYWVFRGKARHLGGYGGAVEPAASGARSLTGGVRPAQSGQISNLTPCASGNLRP